MMNTRYRRNKWARINIFYDDLAWKWERHREGFYCGFAFGVLCVVLVTEFVLGV